MKAPTVSAGHYVRVRYGRTVAERTRQIRIVDPNYTDKHFPSVNPNPKGPEEVPIELFMVCMGAYSSTSQVRERMTALHLVPALPEEVDALIEQRPDDVAGKCGVTLGQVWNDEETGYAYFHSFDGVVVRGEVRIDLEDTIPGQEDDRCWTPWVHFVAKTAPSS